MSIKDRIRKTFLELIAIDGIYPYEDAVIAYVEKRFSEAGVSYIKDSFRNIVVKIPGTGETVMLSTHMDIPEPAPTVKYEEDGDIIRATGENILGADPKTGLAILIEFAIDAIKIDHTTYMPLEFVLTRGEEVGLHGAMNLDYSKISAKMGLVFDEDGPVTQVVTQAPAFVKIDALFKGKIVHPREPEKGVNALQAACNALSRIPCGYSTKGVTWNVGKFKAGTARNSVPGSAELMAELRSYDTALVVAEGNRVEKTFKEAAAQLGGTCEIKNTLEFGGYILDREHPLFVRLEKTYEQMGLVPNYFSTFGGTDANIFNQHGIRCVPVGSGYYNAHEYTEEAHLNDMVEIYQFLQKFCSE